MENLDIPPGTAARTASGFAITARSGIAHSIAISRRMDSVFQLLPLPYFGDSEQFVTRLQIRKRILLGSESAAPHHCRGCATSLSDTQCRCCPLQPDGSVVPLVLGQEAYPRIDFGESLRSSQRCRFDATERPVINC